MTEKQTTHEVVVCVFQHDGITRGKSIGQKSLFFKSIQEVIEWSDDAGVDYR